ncbi:DUF4232 domain-containing protein [Streptomyces sp. J2-1]|uniref:DUF4232 domain-containing protein n=1 Tax=Streptomyces corallincola TaxID=2851888 RepID=UPI001C394BCF|nr:DUF4232 domain-containing protein [Streptomyces corallincola]MBV2354655.1 DUF4232 domain-containing protein [Streptomyces corallincola]
MRVIPLTVTALTAAMLLTACDDGGGAKNGGSDAACVIGGGVSAELGAASVAPAAGDTGQVPVSLTNQSAPCYLDHFAGARLNTADGKHADATVQSGAKAQRLKLNKGDSATFTLTYVRGAAGAGSLDAKSVRITLPGSDQGRDFPWSYGPVATKGGATTPDASVSAFQQVGD